MKKYISGLKAASEREMNRKRSRLTCAGMAVERGSCADIVRANSVRLVLSRRCTVVGVGVGACVCACSCEFVV